MLINPLEIPDWDAQLVERFPEAAVFHTSGWARVLAGTYRHRPMWLAFGGDGDEKPLQGSAESDPQARGQVSGGRSYPRLAHFSALLPLYEVRSRLTGRRGVCVPFADFCAPLYRKAGNTEGNTAGASPDQKGTCHGEMGASAEDLFPSLFNEGVALGKERNWSYLEWRGGCTPPSATPSTVFLSHHLDLRLDEQALLANLDSSVRRALRKAERAKLNIQFRSDAAAMEEYYRLHCLTRRKHGLPPQPYQFFCNIQEHLLAEGGGFVALAFAPERVGAAQQGRGAPEEPSLSPPARPTKAVAGAVFLTFNRVALYKFGASDVRFSELRANNLLMWKALLRCKASGLHRLELGRTEPEHDGLRRFKLSLGAVERAVSYHRFDVRSLRWARDGRGSGGWFNPVFRTVPARLARLAGRVLYPHLD